VPAHKASAVQLSAEHEREPDELVQSHSTPRKMGKWARITLLTAARPGVSETPSLASSVARQLGIWRKTANFPSALRAVSPGARACRRRCGVTCRQYARNAMKVWALIRRPS
jgi:hypothetical protein